MKDTKHLTTKHTKNTKEDQKILFFLLFSSVSCISWLKIKGFKKWKN